MRWRTLTVPMHKGIIGLSAAMLESVPHLIFDLTGVS
jgi:hypothetical protein